MEAAAQQTDVLIIGAGIVGLATAYQLTRHHPHLHVTVLEKEAAVAQHQTGHNSGVLHSGIYYKPGSLKAENCRLGKAALEAFCEAEDLPFERCGKVIVATQPHERPLLDRILERGQANGVACTPIGPERLAELEPHVAGLAALHVPEAGIVNYGQVARRMAARIQERNAALHTRAEVTGVRTQGQRLVVESKAGAFETRFVIGCAGLQADRVAALTGTAARAKIVPFRGEYFELKPEVHHLCRGLIYPVPDPGFPFLGVHFTRMITGGVECGPNAVLALAREGYRKTSLNLRDAADALTYPGFLRLAGRHWRTGLGEVWRSFSKAAFVKALQRLIPEIQAEHLTPAPPGIRAQALQPDGHMVDDFLIQESDRILNITNAPSPAATASLNIGRLIMQRLETRLT